MGRAIISAPAAAPAIEGARGVPDGDAVPASDADNYSDKLLKLIPAEVITGYVALDQILKSSPEPENVPAFVVWLVFGVGVLATWLVVRYTLKVSDWRQIGVTILAFCVWAIALSDPIAATVCTGGEACDWNDMYAKLMLASFTFIAPLVPMGQPA